MATVFRRLDFRVWERKRLIAYACLAVWAFNIMLYLLGVRYPMQFGIQFCLLFGGTWVALMDEPDPAK